MITLIRTPTTSTERSIRRTLGLEEITSIQKLLLDSHVNSVSEASQAFNGLVHFPTIFLNLPGPVCRMYATPLSGICQNGSFWDFQPIHNALTLLCTYDPAYSQIFRHTRTSTNNPLASIHFTKEEGQEVFLLISMI
jgi:hypothetical protein